MSCSITEKIFVGVDVSKFKLDVFHPDTGALVKLDNTESAVDEFCQLLKKKALPVMESWDEDAKKSIREVLEM